MTRTSMARPIPTSPGDEDPTRVTIVSAPVFQVRKISTDLTGDPNVLLAGETLRYTITVKNVGNGNATNVVLRDLCRRTRPTSRAARP